MHEEFEKLGLDYSPVLPQNNILDLTLITKQMRLNADSLMKEMTEHAEKLKEHFSDINHTENFKAKFIDNKKNKSMIEALIDYVVNQAELCYTSDFPVDNIEAWIRRFLMNYEEQ